MLDSPRYAERQQATTALERLAEMAELAGAIDSALEVVRHGRVTHRSLRTLNRQARSWGTKVDGAILTDAVSDEQYGYYGGR